MRKSQNNGTFDLEVMTGLAGRNPAREVVGGH
jgi:hypothetical protein